MAILVTFSMIAFPFWIYYKIHFHFNELHKFKIKFHYGVFYDELNYEKFWCAQYNSAFLIRRILISALLVFGTKTILIQSQAILFMSVANLVFLINTRPYKTPFLNRYEIFNEWCIYSSNILIMSFVDRTHPKVFQDIVGWAMISVAALNISANLLIIVINTVYDLITTIKDYKH